LPISSSRSSALHRRLTALPPPSLHPSTPPPLRPSTPPPLHPSTPPPLKQLINLQSTTEFASHRLNRDTWRDAGVRALLGAGFLLLQAYDVAEEGARLMAFYHVEELPALLVVDPATGAPMRRWSGYVSPDRCATAAGFPIPRRV
jgi:hypothetical protein